MAGSKCARSTPARARRFGHDLDHEPAGPALEAQRLRRFARKCNNAQPLLPAHEANPEALAQRDPQVLLVELRARDVEQASEAIGAEPREAEAGVLAEADPPSHPDPAFGRALELA